MQITKNWSVLFVCKDNSKEMFNNLLGLFAKAHTHGKAIVYKGLMVFIIADKKENLTTLYLNLMLNQAVTRIYINILILIFNFYY